jgi:hypothetical protein
VLERWLITAENLTQCYFMFVCKKVAVLDEVVSFRLGNERLWLIEDAMHFSAVSASFLAKSGMA